MLEGAVMRYHHNVGLGHDEAAHTVLAEKV